MFDVVFVVLSNAIKRAKPLISLGVGSSPQFFLKLWSFILAVSINEFKKALNSLNEAIRLYDLTLQQPVQLKANRDACIQRFEFCIEMAWRLAKKIMGSATTAPNTIIREMAQNNLINDPNIWFSFIEARNKTSHSYDEHIAIEVFNKIKEFVPEAALLYEKLNRS